MNKYEVSRAIERGLKHGLIRSEIKLNSSVHLAEIECRRDIDDIIKSAWCGKTGGLCQVVVLSCIEDIKRHLACEAWPTFGWVTDIERGDIWKMDADELCRRLITGSRNVAKFHGWITLDSGEIIDPTIYPTLAECFPNKFKNGDEKRNILAPDGAPYEINVGLPSFKYHPSVFCN